MLPSIVRKGRLRPRYPMSTTSFTCRLSSVLATNGSSCCCCCCCCWRSQRTRTAIPLQNSNSRLEFLNGNCRGRYVWDHFPRVFFSTNIPTTVGTVRHDNRESDTTIEKHAKYGTYQHTVASQNKMENLIRPLRKDLHILVKEVMDVIDEEETELERLEEEQNESGLSRSKERFRVRFNKAWEDRRRQLVASGRDYGASTSIELDEAVREISSEASEEYLEVEIPTTDKFAEDAARQDEKVTIVGENTDQLSSVLDHGMHSEEFSVSQRNHIKHEHGMEKAFLLLSKMSPREWNLFENGAVSLSSRDLSENDEDNYGLEAIEDLEYTSEEMSLTCDADPKNGFEQEFTEVDRIHHLLEESKRGNIELSIHDYNFLLLQVAIATELSLDDIMGNLLEVYYHMKRFSLPDATTYEILVLSLDRRVSGRDGSNNRIILDLIKDMISFEIQLPSQFLLKEGLRSCQRDNDVGLAKRLIIEFALDRDDRQYKVSNKILRSLMIILARENMQDDAILLLKKCIKENGKSDPRGTDNVFDAAICWPERNRAGKRRDISKMLQNIVDIMDTDGHKPGFSVWRNLILALSRNTHMDTSRWELLRRPFHTFFYQYKNYYPDEFFLRVGLQYCEATNDSKFARDLVARTSARHAKETTDLVISTREYPLSTDESMLASSDFFGDTSWALMGMLGESTTDERNDSNVTVLTGSNRYYTSSDPLLTSHNTDDSTTGPTPNQAAAPFPFKIFQKAIKVCLAAGDVKSCYDILDSLGELEHMFPLNIQSKIWVYALKGLAMISDDSDSVEQVVSSMKQRGIKLDEESYGAIMHSLVASNRPEEARRMLVNMENGEMDPGLTCYNAIMLSYINTKAWEDVVAIFQKMKSTGLHANSSTTQMVMIATFHLGGRSQAKQFVQELTTSKVQITRENCYLAMKILLPGLMELAKHSNISDVLRDHGTEHGYLKAVCFNLLRSIRQAEIEQSRRPTKQLPVRSIARRQEEAWETVLRDVLALAQARNTLSEESEGNATELSC